MVNKISASVIPIDELEARFNLVEVEEEHFFPEWQTNLPEIPDRSKQMLDKVKAGYFNLLRHPPLLEHPIRMAVIAPLLFFADFFLSPFPIKHETPVTIVGFMVYCSLSIVHGTINHRQAVSSQQSTHN
ncbi:MAG: hypothetical protein GDA48_14915 [Hormoscilla sp. GM102CHS1]|nr:hypothetical protein [Hormoscilla sp. GM102CHS1]